MLFLVSVPNSMGTLCSVTSLLPLRLIVCHCEFARDASCLKR